MTNVVDTNFLHARLFAAAGDLPVQEAFVVGKEAVIGLQTVALVMRSGKKARCLKWQNQPHERALFYTFC